MDDVEKLPEWYLMEVKSKKHVPISKKDFTIGRSIENNLSFEDSQISRNHAIVHINSDEKIYLEDLQSANGTFLNTIRIVPHTRVRVKEGDIIIFGNPDAIDRIAYKVSKTMDEIVDLDSDGDEPVTVKTEVFPIEVKTEPDESSVENRNTTPCLGFSAAIDCIEISDDEDNDEQTGDSRLTNLFSKIQTQSASQQVKQEPSEFETNTELAYIKSELDYMDHRRENILNNVPIDIEEDYANLLDILSDGYEEVQNKPSENNDESLSNRETINNSVFDLNEFENLTQNLDYHYKEIENNITQYIENQVPNQNLKSEDLQKNMSQNLDVKVKIVKYDISGLNAMSEHEEKISVRNSSHKTDNSEYACRKMSVDSNGKIEVNKKIDSNEESEIDEDAHVSEASGTDPNFSEISDENSDEEDVDENKEMKKVISDPKPSINKNNTKMPTINGIKNGLLTGVLPECSTKSKYVKPPIIPAHAEPFLKRRKGYVDPSLNEKAKQTKPILTKVLKRTKKDLINKEIKPKKRRGRKRKNELQCEAAMKKTKSEVDADIKKEMSRRNMSTDISSNAKISEKHQKAKELMKAKKNNEVNNVGEKVKKAPAKVKVSENRGMFLTQDQPGPSSVALRRKSSDASHDNLRKCFDELLPPKRASPLPTPRPSAHQQESNDDVVAKIIKWSVKWFVEQAEISRSPPVYDLYPSRIKNTYENFDEYKNTMAGLTMLELWSFIYDAFKKEYSSTDLLKAVITHDRVGGIGLFFDCECYITESQIKANNVPKTHDFIICALTYDVNSNSKKSTMQQLSVGLITRCTRIPIDDRMILCNQLLEQRTNKNEPPLFKLKFSLVTRYNPERPIRTDTFALKIVDNIERYFNLFRTVKRLRLSHLKQMVLAPTLTDYQLPSISIQLTDKSEYLNEEQKLIVSEAATVCLSKHPGLYLIHGPPGTGKSTILVHTIFETLINKPDKGCKNGSKILVLAPSNAAIDNLIVKINDFRSGLPEFQKKLIKLVRMGPEQSIGPRAQQSTLSFLSFHHLYMRYKHQLVDFNAKKNEEKLQLFLGKHRFRRELREIELEMLLGSTIICTTLGSACNYRILEPFYRKFITFNCCIIDEATQCTEVETLGPIQFNIENFVFVGDPKQLSATVQNMEARDLGFDQSLFARIFATIGDHPDSPIRMLTTQYRMHREICSFPSRMFYGNKLRSKPKYKNEIIPKIQSYLLFNIIKPLENSESSDYINTNEIFIIQKMLDLFVTKIKSTNYSIGIITPYNHQKDGIHKALNKEEYMHLDVTVNTVDGFQGQEKDIIIISCVRKDPNNFVENDNRLNVALTRAKQALFVIGNYTLFKQTKTLYEIREDSKKRRRCIDIADISEEAVTKILQQWIFVDEKKTKKRDS